MMLEIILLMMFTGRGRPEAGHADAAGDTDHGHALASGGARPQDPHLLLPGHGAQERFVFPCCARLLLLSCLCSLVHAQAHFLSGIRVPLTVLLVTFGLD